METKSITAEDIQAIKDFKIPQSVSKEDAIQILCSAIEFCVNQKIYCEHDETIIRLALEAFRKK